MIQDWLEHINLLLHTHPHLLAQVAFLFRLKCWLLNVLMGYFLYLLYKEPPQDLPKREKPGAGHFLA